MVINIGDDMKMEIEVTGCRDCPYSSNNQQEHDDPFTSTPLHTYWYCNFDLRSRKRVYIPDSYKIPENCPYKEK